MMSKVLEWGAGLFLRLCIVIACVVGYVPATLWVVLSAVLAAGVWTFTGIPFSDTFDCLLTPIMAFLDRL